MALGTFTPPPSKSASSFDPRTHHGKPLIVVAREFLPQHVTRKYPEPRDKVVCDVVDLMADTVVVSVLWGSGAIVDRLKVSVPEEGATAERLPVSIVKVSPSGGGNDYYSVEPLDGTALQLAVAWDQKNPTRIDDERAAKLATDAQNGEPAAGAPGAAPITGLGSAPATPPAAATEEATANAGVTMNDDDLQAAIASLG